MNQRARIIGKMEILSVRKKFVRGCHETSLEWVFVDHSALVAGIN